MRRTLPLLLLCACQAPAPAVAPAPPPPSRSVARPPAAPTVFADAVATLKREDPAWARYVGFHALDGVVRDISAEAFAARIASYRSHLATLDALDPAGLDADAQLDREVLRGKLRLELFDLTTRRVHQRDPATYDDIVDVSGYVNFDYAPMATRVDALVRHVDAARASLPSMLDHLDETLSRPVLETGLKVLGGHAKYLRGDLKQALAPLEDEAKKAKALAAAAALADVIDTVTKRLEDEWLPRADETSHVMGAATYLDFVEAQEGRRFTLDELKELAVADWKRNHDAYVALAPKVKQVTRPAREELLETARDMVKTSKAFIAERDLVTIPTDEMPWVEETPPFMQWNAAFLNPMGPFEKETKAYYYITLPDPAWPEEEQTAYIMPVGTLMATTVHEGFPGHYLHSLWYQRVPTDVQKMFDAYSFVEGWAHYGEQLMVEEGYADDDEEKLGQLGDALLRNCRFLVSIGVHAEGMSLDDAKAKFENDCFQDAVTARQQAARATFDPGYFAYTLGKLQILELRRELKAELGDRFSLRVFHDALLGHGAPPLALIADRVRAAVRAAP